MGNKNFISKQLMFVESVNKNSDVEELLERLILKLETMGVNVIDKENFLYLYSYRKKINKKILRPL